MHQRVSSCSASRGLVPSSLSSAQTAFLPAALKASTAFPPWKGPRPASHSPMVTLASFRNHSFR